MKRLLAPALVLLLAVPALSPCRPPREVLDRWLARAEAMLDDYEYRRAEEIFLRVLAARPESYRATRGLARAATGVGEYPRAAALFRRAARLDPRAAAPERGLGWLALSLDRRAEARRHYEAALRLDPEDPGALSGLARVLIEEKEYEAAGELLDRAEARGADLATVHLTRSEWYFRQGDMTNAARSVRKALAISPRDLGANLRLAAGFLERDRKPWTPPEVPEAWDRAVNRGVSLYRALDLEGAERVFAALDDDRAADMRPAFFRGLAALRRGWTREAIRHLRRVLDREPENTLARNAYAVAYREKIAAQRAEYGGGPGGRDRLRPLARALPAGPVPGIERIVRSYPRLLPRERRAIRRAARPFARFFPILAGVGVRHDILGFEEGVCDAPERSWLRDRRTPDGRWYGGLRGVGGRVAATGIEAVREAADLRYHTFAHELAHQVHIYALGPERQARIRELYVRAKKENRCLDYYAASNDREYFAQGYEAFVSVVKSPFLPALRRHTRAELRERDPALFRFLAEITGTPDPDPGLEPLAPRILAFYEWSGDPVALSRIRSLLAPLLAPAAAPGRSR